MAGVDAPLAAGPRRHGPARSRAQGRGHERGARAGAGPRERRYLAEPSPWRRRDAVRMALLAAIGAVVVIACWYGISGEVTLRGQQGWLVVALLGTALAGIGGVVWLTAGLRAVRLGERALLLDIAEVMDWPAGAVGSHRQGSGRARSAGAGASDRANGDAAERPGGLVTGPGMTFAHLPDCPIVRGKAVEPLSADDAAARGLTACGICAGGKRAGEKRAERAEP